jgi:uncharacterized protein YqhQ
LEARLSSAPKKLDVGGQAVVEGVMMRSPRSFAIVCRRATGEIVVREERWRSLWDSHRFLRWPFFRGGVVLAEALVNGMSALTFSAHQQEIAAEAAAAAKRAEEGAPAEEPRPAKAAKPGGATYTGMIALSVAFALALFVGLPHLLTWLLGFETSTLAFHLVDGGFKVAILVGYIAVIGLVPDIRRVFMYHGAEHKTIWAYERALELTVENTRAQTRFHPRCGTSFLVLVILVSVFLFAVLLRHPVSSVALVDHLAKILIKVPLMFPVAGIAYEGIKLSGRHLRHPIVRVVVAPGLALQRLTTREPDDAQLEVAILALRKTLWRERVPEEIPGERETRIFASFAEAAPAIEA